MPNQNEKELSTGFIFFTIKYDEKDNMYAEELFSKAIFPIVNEEMIDNKGILELVMVRQDEYDVKYKIQRSITNPHILKASNIIYKKDITYATQNETEKINLILNDKKRNGLHKINEKIYYFNSDINYYIKINKKETTKDGYIRIIKDLEKDNVYCNLNIESKKKTQIDLINNSTITDSMNHIEILLLKLNRINPSLKREKEEEYITLLKNIDNNDKLTLSSIYEIIPFEGELEFLINNEKIASDGLLNFLEDLISKYNEDDKTQTTLEDINKINHLFIKDLKKYPLLQQRRIKTLLSLLYIYEINENKEKITSKELENSYFANNIPIIKLCLNDLIESNIIENFIIDLEDNNPETLLETIKNINFINKRQKVKKYE